MVARAGGYYGEAFKGARGVTQGDPLSPTIFNVVGEIGSPCVIPLAPLNDSP